MRQAREVWWFVEIWEHEPLIVGWRTRMDRKPGRQLRFSSCPVFLAPGFLHLYLFYRGERG